MTNQGFIKLPRSLLDDPNWKNLPYTYRHVFLTILANMVFKPTIMDDFGVLIHLRPGQLLITERRLVKLCDEPDIDRSLVHRALVKFKTCHFSDQTSNHKKTIITITRKDILQLIEPNFDHNSNQTRTLKEECKERKEVKEINNLCPKPKFLVLADAITLADFFLQTIRTFKPDFKEPNLPSWQKDFDKMLRLDKRNTEDIRILIHWLPGNHFWRKNILSASKFREQFDRLQLAKEEKTIPINRYQTDRSKVGFGSIGPKNSKVEW